MFRVRLAVLFLLFAVGRTADAAWTRLDTPSFLLVGDAPESRIREAAQRLETFRSVFTALLPSSGSQTRTVVLVFGSDRSFAQYRPLFNGKPIELAGFFQQTRDRAFIVLGNASQESALRTVLHEVAHHIIDSTLPDVPVWANEGLAELYETFEVAPDGRTVRIGIPPAEHVTLLRSSTPMPIREMVSVTHASPTYNEGNRRGLFYAQSWALAHYFMFGSAERRSQFQQYLRTFDAGAPLDISFKRAFGDEKVLEAELREYIRGFTLKMLNVTFANKVGSTAVRGRPLDDAEALGYLGQLLAGMGRLDEARAHFDRALAQRSNAVTPAIGLANLAVRTGNTAEAVRILEDVSVRAPDEVDAQLGLARALMDLAADPGAERSALARARAPLARVMALDPASAEATAMAGYVEVRTGGDVAQAVVLLKKAIALAPGRQEYRLYLAEAYADQRDFAAATSLLGPLMASGSTQQIRDLARRLMAYIADVRAAAAAPAPANAPDTRSSSSSPAPPGGAASVPSGSRSTAPRLILDLRAVAAGEERVLGMLTAIECRSGVPTLLVNASGSTLRLVAPKLDQVIFITYRNDTPGSVQCGTLPKAQRVLATFRKQTAGGLAAVAIELLPDGYELP